MSADRSPLVRQFSIQRILRNGFERIIDTVAAEEPLEIRVQHVFKNATRVQSLAVVMRTPGADRELAAGLLISEGVIQSCDDLLEVRSLGGEPGNEVLAVLAPHVDFEAWRTARTGFLSSSCGLCGKRSMDAIAAELPVSEPERHFRIPRALIDGFPALLRARQQAFAQTGGLHAAAIISADGSLLDAFEDIGRHNALDKLIGSRLLSGRFPLQDSLLFLSSRSSFELIQKAAMARAPLLATVGGPSSLAIEAARRYGITLVGFVRDKRFNVYAGEWRIES